MNNRPRINRKALLCCIRENLFFASLSQLLRLMFGMAIPASDRATNTAASSSRLPAHETAGTGG